MNRDVFFPSIRATAFHGTMDQGQVDGLNALLDASPSTWDTRWLAYALGTVFHETAFTMRPVEELGRGAGKPYGHPDPVLVYYGRGFVQLTWKSNYEAMSPVVGLDLVADPDLALRPDVAAKILFFGMEHGSFTGVGLPRYFTPKSSDWINARRIINGLDCAVQIASYGEQFHEAIVKAVADPPLIA